MQEHDALERELKELVLFEERGVDPTGKWSKMDKKSIKARVRMIKNRLAAKRSREHARTYVQELEGTLEALQTKNEALARRLAAVEAENDKLKKLGGLPVGGVGDGGDIEEETKDRNSEPAALATSLQLDAVLLLLSALASTMPSSLHPAPWPPSPSPPPPRRADPSAPGVLALAPPRCMTAPATSRPWRGGLPSGRLRPQMAACA